jgi:hypothetical protein
VFPHSLPYHVRVEEVVSLWEKMPHIIQNEIRWRREGYFCEGREGK